MKNIAVIYKSKYGATKQYAEWVADSINATLLNASVVKPDQLASFDYVIYGGGLYASGINGVKLVTNNPCNLLAVFTVGIADPDTTNYAAILEKNFSKEILSKIKVFHLRGGIDYKKLGIVHRAMMAMLKRMLIKKNESERTEEDKALLETYGKKIDFSSKKQIESITAFIKRHILA